MTRVFAYGSNLHAGDRQSLGEQPGFLTPGALAVLPERRLAFTRFSTGRQGGVLDVIAAPGCIVDGAIDVVSPAGLAWLDDKEGVGPGHYRRVPTVALTPDGDTTTVDVYEVVRPVPFVEPAPDYLRLVHEARRALGLDTLRLDDAAANRSAGPLARFFFYGTLMEGERNAFHLDGVRVTRRRRAQVHGLLFDRGPYPALICPGGQQDVVHGELVEVEADDVAALCARLDDLEGFHGYGASDTHYERRVIAVTVAGDHDDGSGTFLDRLAWVYVQPTPVLDEAVVDDDAVRERAEARISHGDWRRHRGARA